uniref:Putative secreted protein n=1 Tax=Ixodes ricinus TaxID=34613 RepID=A0A6B0UM34_IXORI
MAATVEGTSWLCPWWWWWWWWSATVRVKLCSSPVCRNTRVSVWHSSVPGSRDPWHRGCRWLLSSSGVGGEGGHLPAAILEPPFFTITTRSWFLSGWSGASPSPACKWWSWSFKSTISM